MNLLLQQPHTLESSVVNQINSLAAQGFKRDPETLIADTKEHLSRADLVQLCYGDHSLLIAFAMYRKCLWQPCY